MRKRKLRVIARNDISKKKCENGMQLDFVIVKRNFEEGTRFYYVYKQRVKRQMRGTLKKSESLKQTSMYSHRLQEPV